MPRPADFTTAMHEAADAEMERARNDPEVRKTIPAIAFEIPSLREAWYIGYWLTEKLKERGIPLPIAKVLCRQNGALLEPGRDPWEVTNGRLAMIYRKAARMMAGESA